MLREFYGSLNAAGFQQVAVVLDASESAKGHSREIINLAGQVLAELPGRMHVRLYFLGNPSQYQAGNFASQAPTWFAQNEKRAGLVSPVFETLPQDGSMSVIVIGSGTVFDLGDWEDTPVLRNTVLVSLAESLQGDECMAEEMIAPSAQELIRRVHDPAVLVEVTGKGFMPLEWDNPSYSLQVAEGVSKLTAERAESYQLAIRCRIRTDCCPEVTVIHSSGRRTSVVLQPADSSCVEACRTGRLTAEEVDVLRAALQRQSFTCPCCGRQTPWDRIRCDSSGVIIGEVIYRSLRDVAPNAFVILRTDAGGAEFSVRACDVLPLAGDEVAVREGGSIHIHRYDPASNRWERSSKPFGQYQQVGEDTYAVLL